MANIVNKSLVLFKDGHDRMELCKQVSYTVGVLSTVNHSVSKIWLKMAMNCAEH